MHERSKGGAARILFTAFEPSGDDLAAAVAGEIRRLAPGVEIAAWGGPKLREAGVEVVEETGADAVVGLPGPRKILEHVRINKRIAAWLDANPTTVHVPVDSPAANFPVCKLSKARGATVVHLAAPQMWAWGHWRVRKLKRLSDLVLCLLPFEEAWFRERGVDAVFIGHPLFSRAVQNDPVYADAAASCVDRPKRLVVLPGSRPKEFVRHIPLMFEICAQLKEKLERVGLELAFALPNKDSLAQATVIADEYGGWPEGAIVSSTGAGPAARWADAALVKSGTVSLHVARQRTPMVVCYRTAVLPYHLVGRWLVKTPHFAMPNLVAGERVVPEFVPHFDGAEPIVQALYPLLAGPAAADTQRRGIERVLDAFEGCLAAEEAARRILVAAGVSV